MTSKFFFSLKSFLELKRSLEIVEQGDLLMGNQVIVTLDFNGEVLKMTYRYYCGHPKSK